MNTAFVLTTINSPNHSMREFSQGSVSAGWSCFVVGDRKTPPKFELTNATYLGVDDCRLDAFAYAADCHENTYARKNLGYLQAIKGGAQIIVESDDDNLPYPRFYDQRCKGVNGHRLGADGWVNVYRYFTDAYIWPRGLPLSEVANSSGLPSRDELPMEVVHSPIQQALADLNPDVDAIYRLLFPGEIQFKHDHCVVLEPGTWCPFNSQNTTWWKEAFPLLYLPTHCSFRMTDIWRSLVAQRIGWEYDWRISFHSPTVWQERNTHDLTKDFKDEVPGYLSNSKIAQILQDLNLSSDSTKILDNLIVAYSALIQHGFVGKGEMRLLNAWRYDMEVLLEGLPDIREYAG